MIRNQFLEKLTDHKQTIENVILQGNLKDFEHYRFLVGQVRGIQDAIDIFQTIFQLRGN